MKIGVLALQGAFREHCESFEALGHETVEVRAPRHLAPVDAVVLPGGESTTVGMLLESSGLAEPLAEALRAGMPALLTCAGLIVAAAKVIEGRDDQIPLQLVDVDVRRNGYGRQRQSFEAQLDIAGMPGESFTGVFIRAPRIERVGADIEVLARFEGDAVLGRQAQVWFSAFHPELAGDLRLHQLFLNEVK